MNLVDTYQSSSTDVPGGRLALGSLHRSRLNITSSTAFKNAQLLHSLYYNLNSYLRVPPILRSIDSELPSRSHSSTREHSDLVLPSRSHSATRDTLT